MVIVFFVASVLIIITQPDVGSLNMNLIQGTAFIALISLLPLAALYIKNKINPLDNVQLLIPRYLHYMSFLASTLYVFIFSHRCDIVYVGLITILYFHWVFIKGECIFTYWEQKLMDPNYQMGSNIYNHPWLQLLVGDFTNHVLLVSYIFIMLTVSIVAKRYFANALIYYAVVFGFLALSLKTNIERYQRSSSLTSIGIS